MRARHVGCLGGDASSRWIAGEMSPVWRILKESSEPKTGAMGRNVRRIDRNITEAEAIERRWMRMSLVCIQFVAVSCRANCRLLSTHRQNIRSEAAVKSDCGHIAS